MTIGESEQPFPPDDGLGAAVLSDTAWVQFVEIGADRYANDPLTRQHLYAQLPQGLDDQAMLGLQGRLRQRIFELRGWAISGAETDRITTHAIHWFGSVAVIHGDRVTALSAANVLVGQRSLRDKFSGLILAIEARKLKVAA